MRRARPLRRRRDSTARPARVRMRERNPCTRRRRRLLGWYVRFMATLQKDERKNVAVYASAETSVNTRAQFAASAPVEIREPPEVRRESERQFPFLFQPAAVHILAPRWGLNATLGQPFPPASWSDGPSERYTGPSLAPVFHICGYRLWNIGR